MPSVIKTELDLYIVSKVKEMRHKLKMSQAELATRLGISNGFMGQVENPKHRAKYNLQHLNKLAIIFNCSPREFLPEKPIKIH